MVDAVAPSLAASLNRTRLVPIADGLAVAVAVSLPWSTSATSILIVLWMIAVLPTLDVASVRREAMTPAGGLPVLLWALGARHAVGRCQLERPPRRPWLVPSSWSFRCSPSSAAQNGAVGGHRVPGLGAGAAHRVVGSRSFGLPWRGKYSTGVRSRTASCRAGFLRSAPSACSPRRWAGAAAAAGSGSGLGGGAVHLNIFYVVTGRTTIVVMVALLLMFGLWFFGWKGVLAAGLIGAVLAASCGSPRPICASA